MSTYDDSNRISLNVTERQERAERVYENLVKFFLGFEPVQDMSIGDIQFIARQTQTYAFDAFGPDFKSKEAA